MARRLYGRKLRAYDAAHGSFLVRELEMAVDSSVWNPAVVMQFWRDVELYGVHEAVLYLQNGQHAKPDELLQLEQLADRLRDTVEGK